MPQFSRHSRRGRILIAIGLGALLVGTSACTRIRTHQGYQVDKLLVDSVQPGIDNRASGEGTLGRPSFVSQFGEQDWYYVSRDMRALAFSSPKPVDQTVLRVRFDPAGNVVAVDEGRYLAAIGNVAGTVSGRFRGFCHHGTHSQNPCTIDVADEIRNVRIVGMHENFLGFALLDDVSVLEDNQVVRQL